MEYKNTQIGTTIIVIMALVITTLHLTIGNSQFSQIWPIYLFLGLVTILFSSLTICIEQGYVTWFFGPRFWKKSIVLGEIESAKAVRNKWYYGLGIRMLPEGWLYNVSGLDAVKIKVRNGETIYLGTNQPQELIRAIEKKTAAKKQQDQT